jgi:hypothetical protein
MRFVQASRWTLIRMTQTIRSISGGLKATRWQRLTGVAGNAESVTQERTDMGYRLLIAMAIFDFIVAIGFFVEGKYPWTIIFVCATISNIASLWLL